MDQTKKTIRPQLKIKVPMYHQKHNVTSPRFMSDVKIRSYPAAVQLTGNPRVIEPLEEEYYICESNLKNLEELIEGAREVSDVRLEKMINIMNKAFKSCFEILDEMKKEISSLNTAKQLKDDTVYIQSLLEQYKNELNQKEYLTKQKLEKENFQEKLLNDTVNEINCIYSPIFEKNKQNGRFFPPIESPD